MKQFIFFMCLVVIALSSCTKFLEEKSDASLSIPDNLDDLESLMNYYAKFVDGPQSGEIAATDFYLTDANWAALSSADARNVYVWSDELFMEDSNNDWLTVYNSVYYSNLVLEKLEKLNEGGMVTDRERFNRVKGEALFNRGRKYLEAAWVWCHAYDAASAGNDLGIPLRLSSNFNEKVFRSTLQQTYEQIVSDLKQSAQLLPLQAEHKVKPSRPAALAMVSRTYLSMRKYADALKYADSSLMLVDELLDFGTLDQTAKQPIPVYNSEVLLSMSLRSGQILNETRMRVSDDLISLYAEDDIRRTIYFKVNTDNSYAFRTRYGNESGTVLFSGPAVNEMYLNRAEGKCRSGDIIGAAADMNTLLSKRFLPEDFEPLQNDMVQEELLTLILNERRKELLFRGLRWPDLKRFNKDGMKIDLSREVDGRIYTLQGNDNRWALMLPPKVVEMGELTQNPR